MDLISERKMKTCELEAEAIAIRQMRYNTRKYERRERNTQRLDVLHKMLHLPASNDRKDISRLLQDVRNCNTSDILRFDLLRDLLECGTHLLLVLVAEPVWLERRTAVLARLETTLLLLIRT